MKKFGILLLLIFIFSQSAVFAIKEAKSPDKINLSFWNLYNDDNLKYFVLRAVESNYDLKIASKNAEIYKHLAGIKKAEEMPTIGAGFSPAYSKMPGLTKADWGFSLPLYVNYEADIFLKNRDKTRAAKKDYEMCLLDEKSAYISVASMTGTIYFNIVKLDKIIEYQEEIVQLRKQIFDLMKLSNKEGLISAQDVINADKSYIQGNVELIELKKERLKLINALAVMVGENPNKTADFQYSNLENILFTGEIPASIESSKITQRPDYLKAEAMVQKQGINVRVAKKEFLPTISITGLSLFNASEFGSLLTTKNALASVGGALLADLFTGGRKWLNLKINKEQYEIALQNYEKTNLTAIQEVNDALAVIKADNEKYERNKKQNELEIKDYSLRKSRYNEGVISKLELIQSKENLLNIQKLVLSNKAECFVDYIGLYKALGANL